MAGSNPFNVQAGLGLGWYLLNILLPRIRGWAATVPPTALVHP